MPQDVNLTSTLMAALTGLVAVLLFYVARPLEERRAVMGVALGAFLLKAALVPVYYWVLIEEGLHGFAYVDSGDYDFHSREMADEIGHGREHFSLGWSYEDPGYNVLGALAYLTFGANTLVMRMLNVAISSWTLLYVYRIGIQSFDSVIARRAVLLTAFLPFSMVIAINHRKDPWVQFFATYLIYHGMRILLRNPGWATSFGWILVGIVPMYFLRHSFVLPYIGVLLLSYFLARRSVLDRMAFGVVGLMAVVMMQLAVGQESRLSVERNMAKFQGRFEESAAQADIGGFVRFARMESIGEIYKLPLLAVLTVILPFPPHFDLVQVPSTLLSWANFFFLIFLPQFLYGLRECWRPGERRRRLPLLIVVVLFITLIGAVNVSVSRYKETVLPIALLITAAGTTLRQSLPFIAMVYGGLVGLAMLIYVRWYM